MNQPNNNQSTQLRILPSIINLTTREFFEISFSSMFNARLKIDAQLIHCQLILIRNECCHTFKKVGTGYLTFTKSQPKNTCRAKDDKELCGAGIVLFVGAGQLKSRTSASVLYLQLPLNFIIIHLKSKALSLHKSTLHYTRQRPINLRVNNNQYQT